MRVSITLLLLVCAQTWIGCGAALEEETGTRGHIAFEHVATAENTNISTTLLDSNRYPALADPNTKLIVTRKVNINGFLITPFNDIPVGVYYDSTEGRWGIANSNLGTAIQEGSRFNVLILAESERSFVFEVAGTSPSDAIIDHPMASDPNAKFFITPYFAPDGPFPVPEATSVRFNLFLSGERWTLRRETAGGFAGGEKFNVYVASNSDLAARFISPVDTFALQLFNLGDPNYSGMQFITNDSTNVAGFIDKAFGIGDDNGTSRFIRNMTGATQVESDEAFNVLTVF